MIPKPLSAVTASDIQDLVARGEEERRTLEFKQRLPGGTDSEKKEFLADVSSLANSIGGDIIYGIVEEQGAAVAVNGIGSPDQDNLRLQLENIIRSGLEPRVQVGFHFVVLDSQVTVLVLRVARSWIGPHRIKFKNDHRFFKRSSSGKYLMDVFDLRTAFTLTETLLDRLRAFRHNRLLELQHGEKPIRLKYSQKLILQLLPLWSFEPDSRIDFDRIEPALQNLPLLVDGGVPDKRHTFEGLLLFLPDEIETAWSYVHLYRSGIVEAVDTWVLGNSNNTVRSTEIEKMLLQSFKAYLSCLETLEVPGPIACSITLAGVNRYRLEVPRRNMGARIRSYPIDRDPLELPEIFVDETTSRDDSKLQPAFDVLWNTCGYPRCFNFDDSGRWQP